VNTLSWFLYLAELVDKLQHLAAAVSVLGGVVAMFVTGYVFIEGGSKKFLFLWLPVCFAVLVVIVTPSKNTLYAIAASELGEKALQTSLAKKTVTAIENWIDSQVKK